MVYAKGLTLLEKTVEPQMVTDGNTVWYNN